MPAKNTVTVPLSREQAAATARWLGEYRPDPTQRDVPADWCDQQMALASALASALAKAARRKRQAATFGVNLPRALAQWLASFYRPDGWWDFGDCLLAGQPAPVPIRTVAALALRAVSGRKGRPRLTIAGTEGQIVRGRKVEADARVLRRLRAGKRDLEWERHEIDAAGPEPEA